MEITHMADFLSKNSSALFTLAGAALATIASFLTASIMANKEIKLKLREKILDRRIEAHERIIELSHTMRVIFPLGGLDAQGEVIRTTSILLSKEAFDEWFGHFFDILSSTSNWLGADLVHELNLLQDYLVNLNEFLRQVPSQNYQKVGQIIRLDFLHFSETTERLAFEFFVNDLEKLRISTLPKQHKYLRKETERRLNETEFGKHRTELLMFIQTS
jgi:hypothetical protein